MTAVSQRHQRRAFSRWSTSAAIQIGRPRLPAAPSPPAYLPKFASFLSALVNRYSKPPYNVHYWEIYNEPDNTDVNRAWLGGCWGGKGKEYGDMLKTAYPAIKAADPDAEVMLGSICTPCSLAGSSIVSGHNSDG